MCTPIQGRFVMNGSPRHYIGRARRQGRPHSKGETMCKGKDKPLQESATLEIVGKVGRSMSARKAGTG